MVDGARAGSGMTAVMPAGASRLSQPGEGITGTAAKGGPGGGQRQEEEHAHQRVCEDSGASSASQNLSPLIHLFIKKQQMKCSLDSLAISSMAWGLEESRYFHK